MGARGSGAGTVRRGESCPICGWNEWRQRGKSFVCRECERRATRRNKKRQRNDPAFVLWEGARARAKASLVPFALTLEDIQAVWPADGLCPALGIPLVAGIGFTADTSPTLDRLNPEWGYEPSNIAVISMKANRAKNRLSATELEKIARWMRTNGLD